MFIMGIAVPFPETSRKPRGLLPVRKTWRRSDRGQSTRDIIILSIEGGQRERSISRPRKGPIIRAGVPVCGIRGRTDLFSTPSGVSFTRRRGVGVRLSSGGDAVPRIKNTERGIGRQYYG